MAAEQAAPPADLTRAYVPSRLFQSDPALEYSVYPDRFGFSAQKHETAAELRNLHETMDAVSQSFFTTRAANTDHESAKHFR